MSLSAVLAAECRTSFPRCQIFAAPPQIRIGNRLRCDAEVCVANQREILLRRFLHFHRMAKQQTNHPRANVAPGRFSEQQNTARPQHSVKLGDRFFLFDQMMKSLMAEQQIPSRFPSAASNSNCKSVRRECRPVELLWLRRAALPDRYPCRSIAAAQSAAAISAVNAPSRNRHRRSPDKKFCVAESADPDRPALYPRPRCKAIRCAASSLQRIATRCGSLRAGSR